MLLGNCLTTFGKWCIEKLSDFRAAQFFLAEKLWRINSLGVVKNAFLQSALEKNEGRGYQRQLKCCYVFMLRWWISIVSPNSGECKFPGALFPRRLPSSWDAHVLMQGREKRKHLFFFFFHFFPPVYLQFHKFQSRPFLALRFLTSSSCAPVCARENYLWKMS